MNNQEIILSELDELAKFISEQTGEPCEAEDILHIRRVKEPLGGSPKESVVQQAAKDGACRKILDVQQSAALIAELEKRAIALSESADSLRAKCTVDYLKGWHAGVDEAAQIFRLWLRELSVAQQAQCEAVDGERAAADC